MLCGRIHNLIKLIHFLTFIKINNSTIYQSYSPNLDSSVTLWRSPNQLSFFYLPNYTLSEVVSTTFRTDSGVGLVFFGQHQNPKNDGFQRFQVQFEGRYMYAGLLQEVKGGGRVYYSCRVDRPEGYANNEDIFVELHFKDEVKLSVDSNSCILDTESIGMDMLDFHYKSSYNDSVLFVGGYYTYAYDNIDRVDAQFRAEYGEKTFEKAPSIRGCIKSITIDNKDKNLKHILETQAQNLEIKKYKNTPLFSMSFGCLQCSEEFLRGCKGAPCRPKTYDIIHNHISYLEPMCDCGAINANTVNGTCMTTFPYKSLVRPKMIQLTGSKNNVLKHIPHPPTFTILSKVWTLVRIPTSLEEVRLFTLGNTDVRTRNFGKIIEVKVAHHVIDFPIMNPDDERLHLISIERNPAFSTKDRSQTLTVRVDGLHEQIRHTHISDVNHVAIHVTEKSNYTSYTPEDGCIAELSLVYESQDSESNELYTHTLDIVEKLFLNPAANQKALNHKYCGVREMAMWNKPTEFRSCQDCRKKSTKTFHIISQTLKTVKDATSFGCELFDDKILCKKTLENVFRHINEVNELFFGAHNFFCQQNKLCSD